MLDNKYLANEKEEKWKEFWKENKVYEFKKDARKVFSIDTPPPTVNGKIHIGHIFSYSQTEMIARYKRLQGFNVFYPFGFDDNGLPSERLVEQEENKKAKEIGREEFLKLCYATTDKYEDEFKKLFTRMGISASLDTAYKTVSPSTIKISQASFLDLVQKGHCYHQESPALWCNECLTSIAQAELETKVTQTLFNYINFKEEETGEIFTIATTRPELLPAIVCVFVNPEDNKYKHLRGKNALIPLLDITVPILGDENVDCNKGTGVVMCCTFGDQQDIAWWKKYKLPLKHIFTENGRIVNSVKKYGGMKIKEARNSIVEDLKELGVLVKQEELSHEVQIHERCSKEVEYSVLKQWFIDTTSKKEEFLKIGDQINWYPSYMKHRYNEWVENIMWDWCISRQRYFGVPFPVWYCKDCGEIIFADKEDLPVNPLMDKPKINKCPKCGGVEFIPETDVMDTWATSAITPMINMKYGEKDNYEDILQPMSIRMNAHDIIRTWDFYTIVKSYYHLGIKPWESVVISGFGLNSNGEKISKRKQNSEITPNALIEKYSADVLRYWSATSKLGTDSFFSEETMKIGKKLVNKIWNVSKFIEMHLKDFEDKEFTEFEYIDKWILAKYMLTEKAFLKYLDSFEVGLALGVLEKFFWNFCDDYIEIVKHRLYRPEEFGNRPRYSGQKTVYILLYKLLQNFSIFFPFITEEIYQEIYRKEKENISIHISKIEELDFNFEEQRKYGDKIAEIIGYARGEKSNANTSLKTPISNLSIEVTTKQKEAIEKSLLDFKACLFIENLELIENDNLDNEYFIKDIKLKIEE